MKILFLPQNIASMQATMAYSLNQVAGVEARSLIHDASKYNSINEYVVYLPKPVFRFSSVFASIIKRYKYVRNLKKWIRWADVLHYVWGPAMDNGKDVEWAAKMNKPIFIEWVGSDIRNPNVLNNNKYYLEALERGYEYLDIENGPYKDWVQQLFSKFNAIPTLLPEMTLFLKKELFPIYFLLPHRLNMNEYIPQFPSVYTKKPIIVHSPTARIGKGSDVIGSVIRELKNEFDFDFVMLHNRTRGEVLKLISEADIFIDQIIVGGYGMAACEAMAFGKPVVAYVMEEVFNAGLSDDCPIVNANPDTIKEQLSRLIIDSNLRSQIGKRSRAFVEQYNDVSKISAEYIKIYQHAINKSKK